MAMPPDNLPRYRVLTGPDDDAFCHRVSEALSIGFELYGSPSVAFNGDNVIVAQAVLWPGETTTAAETAPEKTMLNFRTLGAR